MSSCDSAATETLFLKLDSRKLEIVQESGKVMGDERVWAGD